MIKTQSVIASTTAIETMKLSFETFGEAKVAVIPLYPLAPWNDTGVKRKAKGEGEGEAEGKAEAEAEADASTFNEIKLELRSNPENADSVKVGAKQWCR